MKRFVAIAAQVGALVERKNAAYGSSFAKAGAALRLLYPQGIAPCQMDDALLLARIWDKLQRIATDGDPLGESPYLDIAGYGILGVAIHQPPAQQGERGDRSQLPASVSTPRVRQSGRGQRKVLQRKVSRSGLEKAPRKN